MKRYQFQSTSIISADNEENAVNYFVNNSEYFAANAVCTEVKMSSEEIRRLVLNEGLTITDLIDEVVQMNGFIGVGLIRLADELKEYIESKISKVW